VRERACVHAGTCYPANHVAAAFDSHGDAERAEAALRGEGFTDVDLFHGREAYSAIVDASRREPVPTRIWRRLRDLGGEGELYRQYLLTLQRGGSYLIVRTDTYEQASGARTVLMSHHAHDIWRLGVWTLERLPEHQVVTGDEQTH
jgi:hypothetical protein